MVSQVTKYSKGGREVKLWNVTTFFFSHFPQRWGRVEEVFISRKLNRWRNLFGFVRFCGVKNIPRLESELDAIRIGAMKLPENLSTAQRYSQPINSKQPESKSKVVKKWKAKVGNGNTEQRRNNITKAKASKQD